MNSLAGGWVILCALVVATGWLLSWLHALNIGGYLFASTAILGVMGLWTRRNRGVWAGRQRLLPARRRRFRCGLPLLFLILALLALLGGFLHPPNNYDAMTYREPRMLSWLSLEQWHWIHTLNERQNDRAQGYEWLSMPLLVFTRTDRAFFLINAVSFALLPGLVFSAFTRLGVRTRVAWSWMWLLPSGYSLALQAGGISNDVVAVPFALAALDFALRARRSQQVGDAWLSVLAAALMTAVKGSNLPLLLPWFAALLPSWRLFLRTPLRTAGLVVLAGAASFWPTALLNQRHCGDWSGAALEVPSEAVPTPGLAFLVNGGQLLAQNLAPPVFPLAGWWNARVMEWLPAGLRTAVEESNFRSRVFNLGELQVEDAAGLGFGLGMLMVVSLAWILINLFRSGRERRVLCSTARVFPHRFTSLLIWLPWASLAVYMAKVATTCAGRLVTPYYPLLLLGLVSLPGWGTLVRQRWWHRLAASVLGLAVAVIVVNPARPILPAQTLLAVVQGWKPESRLVERAARVYATYAQRHDALAPIRDVLPPTARRVGLAGSLDHPEASLWRPFGSRTIVHVLPSDTPEQVRAAGLEYVVLTPEFTERFPMPLEDWLRDYQAETVRAVEFSHLASQPPRAWHLVRLLPGGGPRP